MVAVYSSIIALGAQDWLMTTGFGHRHDGWLLQFATVPTLATFGVILLRRFAGAMRQTDELNRELEARVAAKSREIAVSYATSEALRSEQLLAQERERIMREVHDGVGGQLIGALSRLDTADPREAAFAEDLRGALRDLRLTIDSLESVEGDLITALALIRNRLQDQLDEAGIQLQWQVGELPLIDTLGPERVLHILRIAQESFTNAIKHSGCTEISVLTHAAAEIEGHNCIAIEIKDNGTGMTGEETAGRGLKNMRYRAEQANLLLEVQHEGGVAVKIGIRE